jgi:hypothetical protein
MLSGTTPNVAASYQFYEAGNTWAGVADVTGSAGTTYWFGLRSNAFFMGTMDIQSPNMAQFTTFQSEGVDSTQSWQARGVHQVNTAYDGIQFKHGGAGNISLIATCYGYRKQ